MQLVKVAAATLNQTPLDWDGNQRMMLAAIARARAERVSILCLPELCITGYGCEDMFLSPSVLATASAVLCEILPACEGIVVSVGLPILHNKAVYNCSGLIADGKLLGFVAKRALAGDGIHYEPRWFKPWPRHKRSLTRVAGSDVPIGDVYFDVGGIKIGFEICEDAWIANRPGAELSLDAVDVILNPSASHFAFGKRDVRRRLVLEGSRAFGVSYVYSNLLGNEAGRAIYDGDALIASGGRIVAAAPRFSFADHTLVTALVDVELTRSRHGWLSSFRPHVSPEPGEHVVAEHQYPELEPHPRSLVEPAWESSPSIKEEEFTRAIALGLFDYLRKSHSRGFVVSLSGGADSSAVACLVAQMVKLGCAELSLDGFRDKLAHVPGLRDAKSEQELVGQLLSTVYQSTCNSSETTRAAARAVAHAVGARHYELDVDPLVNGYVERVSQALGRELSWQTDDIALQNIQARARAPSAWMFANLEGALLLATSNRSEAAVGYATMDGDTAGGLSPIAGIDKAFLRRWLAWMERTGPDGFGPIPALSAVTAQAPTAELRPALAGQTDEADLMPYELLDAIERAAIRDKRSPSEVYRLMRADFPGYSPSELLTWLERFFRLWSQNQWKRERYAPSFHVDDANLDPKTWCRFPILSGGYQRELAELRARVRTTP
jgi:NAD+ synthase (glutamine-hydrolysing)